MEFVDRHIACIDCGQPFLFSSGEQEFYDRKGFREEPKRCKPCRDARKVRRTGQLMEGVAADKRPSPGDDDDSIGNRAPSPDMPDDGIGNRAPASRAGAPRGGRELFEAVCARCGAATRVPFRPVVGRAVYCRECFGARRGAVS
jgi:CxxC-x17-CxxC domain-containing protein